ncbi:MAG: hypothetical protein GXO74_05280 [Calditrichaeota bacterium]|nr:hypothetical protein [Calditrichota bacterium]
MKKSQLFLAVVFSIFFLASAASAQVPRFINYQGVLTDPATNNPVADNTYSITFSIYSVETLGTALWTETQDVTIVSGHFSVLLGSITPLPLSAFNGSNRYLGIKVNSDDEMVPRKRIVSVAYSFEANNADKLDDKDASAFALVDHNHDTVYYKKTQLRTSDGTPPNNGSNMVSWNNLKDVPSGFADGTDDTGSGGGISQINVGTGMTVSHPTGPTATLGLEMGHGNGINADKVDGKHASNFATSSHTHSGSDITTGKINNARLHTGSGNGLDADKVDGKHASNFANASHNHWGAQWSGSGLGLKLTSSNNDGVEGWTSASAKSGLYGHSTNGYGVTGRSTNNNGVQGITSGGSSAYGVKGTSSGSGGTGVFGEANNGSYAYGVWGKSTSGYAGYFNGDVHVSGSFSASSKSFAIDHPLDPANEYLYHYSIESNERYNVYSGNVVLDANGGATVKLSQWFQALNKDFRYQLTCIGGFAQVYIADEIQNNTFKIAGGKPGMKISWQVTGIRNDAYAKKHPAQVEKEKQGLERGKYLNPEAFGLPKTMGMESIKENH